MSKKKRIFKGVSTALVTPFHDGKTDLLSLKKIVEFQLENKIDSLTVCGTTGEASTLTFKERRELIGKCAEYVDTRVPLIVGTGTNDTKTTVRFSRSACRDGADALLVVTPYYNKTTQSGLVRHYYTVADAVTKPVIIYNVPSRTGMNILPETYFELSKHENIIAVKEAGTNVADVARTMLLCGDALDVYSGCDDLALAVMSLGGAGVISVLSNIIPQKMSRLCSSFFKGDISGAANIQKEIMPLCDAIFSKVNPIPIKAAMELMGFCDRCVRAPLVDMSDAETENLKAVLKGFI